MQVRAPPGGSKRGHLRHRISRSAPSRPAHQRPPHRAMPGGQFRAHPQRAAPAEDDPPPDDAGAERTALLRTPAPAGTPVSGSVGGAARQLRTHSAASFSIEGEGGGGHDGRDAASLDGVSSDEFDGAASQGSPPPPGVDVLAQLSLLCVAFIWGTYTPALRFLYQTPGPPSAAVLTGVRSTIQALTLVLPSLIVGAPRSGHASLQRHNHQRCHGSCL